MRFWEALKELESGEKIRRRHFSHIICSFLDLADFLTGSGIEEIYSHLNADWELYQLPEKTYSFPEVVQDLKKMKKFKRKDWDFYITGIETGEIHVNEPQFRNLLDWICEIEDFEATDWIEVL